MHMYHLAQCGIGSAVPFFRVAAEASMAAVWNYTRCYLHYKVANIAYHTIFLFYIP